MLAVKIILNQETTLIGKLLREMRGRMTLQDVADQAGIDYTCLSRIERGVTMPSIENLRKILLWVGVPKEQWHKYLNMTRK